LWSCSWGAGVAQWLVLTARRGHRLLLQAQPISTGTPPGRGNYANHRLRPDDGNFLE
jgi:hypothetical protein